MRMASRRGFITFSLASVALAGANRCFGDTAEPAQKAAWPFYVMDTGLVGPDVPELADKLALARRLGFAGFEYTLNHQSLPSLLERLDRQGLELEGVYTSPMLEEKPDPLLATTIQRLKGRSTRIELAIRSSKCASSDPAGDQSALELLKPISDWCGDSGPKLSIYPHTHNWAERVDDGVRLADKLGRKNIGTNFNLVHWKWVTQTRPLEETLQSSLPHLLAVTINGLVDQKIVPLDEGNFDLAAFLATLKKVGYRGPVGLQGFGIPGTSEAHLTKSITAWKNLLSQM